MTASRVARAGLTGWMPGPMLNNTKQCLDASQSVTRFSPKEVKGSGKEVDMASMSDN